MDLRKYSALFLVGLMALAGCLGGTESVPDFEEPTASTYTLQPTWILSPAEVQLGEEVSYLLGIEQEGEGVWEVEVSVLQPNFSPLSSLDWKEQNQGYQLTFTPETTGEHIVSGPFEIRE